MADVIDINKRLKEKNRAVTLKKKSDYIVKEFNSIIDNNKELTMEDRKSRIKASLERIEKLIEVLKCNWKK